MPQRKLKVIPEPKSKTRSVLDYTGAGTIVMKGPGDEDLLCGTCGAVLVQGIGKTIKNMVLICNDCKSYNDTE